MKTFQQFTEQLNEADSKSPHQAMAKKIGFPKMPAKESWRTIGQQENESHWNKHGGHAGRNTIDKLVSKAKAAGFTEVEDIGSNSPDGNYVGYGSHYSHPEGHHLHVNKSYGPTKDYNDFSANLKYTPK